MTPISTRNAPTSSVGRMCSCDRPVIGASSAFVLLLLTALPACLLAWCPSATVAHPHRADFQGIAARLSSACRSDDTALLVGVQPHLPAEHRDPEVAGSSRVRLCSQAVPRLQLPQAAEALHIPAQHDPASIVLQYLSTPLLACSSRSPGLRQQTIWAWANKFRPGSCQDAGCMAHSAAWTRLSHIRRAHLWQGVQVGLQPCGDRGHLVHLHTIGLPNGPADATTSSPYMPWVTCLESGLGGMVVQLQPAIRSGALPYMPQ